TGTPAPDMRLGLGVKVAVQVADPLGLASVPGLRMPGSAVAVTLTEGGKARMLPLTAQAGLSHEYSELVPPGRTVQLKVASSEFLLGDGSGSPIEDGHVFSVVTPAAPVVVQVQVRAKKIF